VFPKQVTDHFATLNEPRRPWLDAEALKQKFLALSAGVHPDRMHNAPAPERRAANERFASLTAAYHCLSEPRHRLQHLLELERGAAPTATARVPPELTDLMLAAGDLCRQVDAFLLERSRETSPLLRVRLFEQGLEWTERLKATAQQLYAVADRLEQEVQALDAGWGSAASQSESARDRDRRLAVLEGLFHRHSYVARCAAQIQERVTRLAV
jgi:curved DNA-binding protein CbpA